VHELSICNSLLREVQALAVQHGAIGVERIRIEVGALSGVEPALLDRAFDVACAGSFAAGAVLVIDVLPVVVCCQVCHTESTTLPNRLLCAACGVWQVRVVRGDELRLRQIELRLPRPDAPVIH
jgi:hydrogenase nickel incorporation protein HypA/HybF